MSMYPDDMPLTWRQHCYDGLFYDPLAFRLLRRDTLRRIRRFLYNVAVAAVMAQAKLPQPDTDSERT